MEISIITKKYYKLLSAFLFIIIYALTAFPAVIPAHAQEPLLVIRTQGKDFEQALKGLNQELEEEFYINEMIITRNTTINEIAEKMKQISPKIVVLMDNISISLYKKYQAGLPASAPMVPSVCLMASFMDIAVQGIKNTAGIFYEVPLVTSVVNLRNILSRVKFRRVGVIFRSFMKPFIKLNQKYCKKEQIELVPYSIPARGNMKSALKKGLKILELRKNIDALWVLNDNMLVNADLLRNVWFPFAGKFKKPVIVGAEILVRPRFKFGTFGVIPDHVELGVQAAEMIYDIMENNWQTENKGIEQPRSVYKIINSDQAQRLFQVKKEKLGLADKVLR